MYLSKRKNQQNMLHLQIFTFNVASENTYLLYNDKNHAWLFDPGNMNEKETAVLENFITEKILPLPTFFLHTHIWTTFLVCSGLLINTKFR